LAVIGFLAGCSMFDYSTIVSRKFALIYGVAKYIAAVPDSTYPNLGYPAADAAGVSAMLADRGYSVTSRWVDASGKVFLNGSQVGTINDVTPDPNAPSKATIQNDIDNLSSLVGPSDVVVFYFSGHGMTDGPHEWFVSYGGIDPGTYSGDEVTSVEDNELGGMLRVLKTPRKVVILDTCNSGGFIGNKLEVDIIPESSGGALPIVTPSTIAQAIANYFAFQSSPNGISPYGGAMVLSAAGAAENSYETRTLGHGVMTYYLLQAPSFGDLNFDGSTTVMEAFSLVKAGIDGNWNSDPGVQAANETFEPRVSGGPVDFVIF
jgi:uncharacterized caspase-like protein